MYKKILFESHRAQLHDTKQPERVERTNKWHIHKNMSENNQCQRLRQTKTTEKRQTDYKLAVILYIFQSEGATYAGGIGGLLPACAQGPIFF